MTESAIRLLLDHSDALNLKQVVLQTLINHYDLPFSVEELNNVYKRARTIPSGFHSHLLLMLTDSLNRYKDFHIAILYAINDKSFNPKQLFELSRVTDTYGFFWTLTHDWTLTAEESLLYKLQEYYYFDALELNDKINGRLGEKHLEYFSNRRGRNTKPAVK